MCLSLLKRRRIPLQPLYIKNSVKMRPSVGESCQFYCLLQNRCLRFGNRIDPMKDEALIPLHGGYRNLKSFQVAQVAYDVTVRFCDRSITKRSRTHDQMAQAARSGVQNIAEGSQASGTSKKTELKLTSVARASLEELRLDYEDFLRQRGLRQWPREDARRAELIARRPGTCRMDSMDEMDSVDNARKANRVRSPLSPPSPRSLPMGPWRSLLWRAACLTAKWPLWETHLWRKAGLPSASTASARKRVPGPAANSGHESLPIAPTLRYAGGNAGCGRKASQARSRFRGSRTTCPAKSKG